MGPTGHAGPARGPILLFGVQPRRRYRALFTVSGDEVILLTIRAPGERPITPEDLPIESGS
jgi:hypothetical protein